MEVASRRLKTWWVGAVIAVVVIGLSPASATNWGSTGSQGAGGTQNAVSLLPSSTMTVDRINLTATNSTAINSAAINQFGSTNLTVVVRAPSNTCATGQRICVFDSNYGNNGLYGWAACDTGSSGTNPNRTCSRQFVRLNTSYTLPSAQRLACHELAHTVGLRHSSQTSSCVYTPIDDGSTASLTAHDIAHINARY